MFALYTDRCSVIEPGPVSTSFVANAQMTESDTHPEEVDDETKQLLNNCIKKMRGAFSTMVQTPDEIAQVILAALDAERPHLGIKLTRIMHLLQQTSWWISQVTNQWK